MICEEKINECLSMLQRIFVGTISHPQISLLSRRVLETCQIFPPLGELEDKRIKKNQVPLSEIITDLNRIYDTIYEIDFYIYRAERKRTIIEVQYFSKDSVAHGEYINDIMPMIHCKVATPLYYEDDKQKFDVNWEHDPFLHQWKMFWWGRKIKYLLMGHDRKSDFSN
jgi:hypothetical protein